MTNKKELIYKLLIYTLVFDIINSIQPNYYYVARYKSFE